MVKLIKIKVRLIQKKFSYYKIYRMKNNSGKINTKLSNQYIYIYIYIYIYT